MNYRKPPIRLKKGRSGNPRGWPAKPHESAGKICAKGVDEIQWKRGTVAAKERTTMAQQEAPIRCVAETEAENEPSKHDPSAAARD
jgi:hypothetical protein